MSRFYLTANDREPAIEATLTDQGTAINCTNATGVTFTMRLRHATTPTVDGAAATWTNQAGGIAKYEWAAGDTDEPGTYECYWSVAWGPGGTLVQTVPARDRDLVVIAPTLT